MAGRLNAWAVILPRSPAPPYISFKVLSIFLFFVKQKFALPCLVVIFWRVFRLIGGDRCPNQIKFASSRKNIGAFQTHFARFYLFHFKTKKLQPRLKGLQNFKFKPRLPIFRKHCHKPILAEYVKK